MAAPAHDAVGPNSALSKTSHDHQRVDTPSPDVRPIISPTSPTLPLYGLERVDHAADGRAVDLPLILVDRRDVEEAVPAHAIEHTGGGELRPPPPVRPDYSAKQGPKISALVTSSPGSDQ